VSSLAAILPAAGLSTRFGRRRNKLLEDLGGQSVICRSIEAFASRDDCGLIVVATGFSPQDVPCLGQKRVTLCPGGTCRAESVQRALECVPETIEWVAVHDAARPLVSQELIDRVLGAAQRSGAAGPAQPVHLTIKESDTRLPSTTCRTLPRGRLWAMQTPQIMRRADLMTAFEKCPIPLSEVTDDLQLMELAGFPICLIPGEDDNIKITTPMDLAIARTIFTGRQTTPDLS